MAVWACSTGIVCIHVYRCMYLLHALCYLYFLIADYARVQVKFHLSQLNLSYPKKIFLASYNVAKILWQCEGEHIIACYLILMNSPWQHQDVPMTTKAARWPDNAGEITRDNWHDLLPWCIWLLCPEQLPSPLLPPASCSKCLGEDTKKPPVHQRNTASDKGRKISI